MALAEPKQDALTARLAGLSLQDGPDWLREARQAALARLNSMGLPARRDEYWRFTRPDLFNAPAPNEAALFVDDEGPAFGGTDKLTIVFTDGVFDADASDPLEGEGLEILRLADMPDLSWAREAYGQLEAASHEKVDRPFAALNTAFASDGLVIRATGVVNRPVAVVYHHKDTTSDAVLHHLVRVEAGAALTILESGPAAARFNKLWEVEVAQGGALHHVRVQGRDHERAAVTHMFSRVHAEATLKSFTLTANGRMTRNEQVVWLSGDNAVAHVAGAALGDGDFHHDDTVFITHEAEHCESRQVYKKVLRNAAVGVFQGKILVREGAQKTDGYQISQSLLLTEDAQFLAKPELEIYADDVACSHGSTSGAIDETALFYLRSRGVPEDEARDLLVLSFLAEAIEEIEDEALAADINAKLEGWLRRRRAA